MKDKEMGCVEKSRGMLITIDSKRLNNFAPQCEDWVEIEVIVDGESKTMTCEEFKRRIFKEEL